jgi:hypothetical protein
VIAQRRGGERRAEIEDHTWAGAGIRQDGEELMPDELAFDRQWVVEQIMGINDKLAALPAIKNHLDSLNGATTRALKNCQALNVRVSRLEVEERRRAKNWTSIAGSGLKIIEGVAIAYLLARVLGGT